MPGYALSAMGGVHCHWTRLISLFNWLSLLCGFFDQHRQRSTILFYRRVAYQAEYHGATTVHRMAWWRRCLTFGLLGAPRVGVPDRGQHGNTGIKRTLNLARTVGRPGPARRGVPAATASPIGTAAAADARAGGRACVINL